MAEGETAITCDGKLGWGTQCRCRSDTRKGLVKPQDGVGQTQRRCRSDTGRVSVRPLKEPVLDVKGNNKSSQPK